MIRCIPHGARFVPTCSRCRRSLDDAHARLRLMTLWRNIAVAAFLGAADDVTRTRGWMDDEVRALRQRAAALTFGGDL